MNKTLSQRISSAHSRINMLEHRLASIERNGGRGDIDNKSDTVSQIVIPARVLRMSYTEDTPSRKVYEVRVKTLHGDMYSWVYADDIKIAGEAQ